MQGTHRRNKRKQGTLKAVAKAYSTASKYQIADWKTAALFKLGSAFEEYGRFLWESERPMGLDGTQLASYEAKLKSEIQPYQKQALDTYKANVNLGIENGLENEWIQKSKLRLAELEVKLGLKATPPPMPSVGQNNSQTSNGLANKSRLNNE